jgi:hypothetical protein
MADPNVVLEQWYRYEEIAMHFNTLIMQFRLQLLGGAGLIGTVASYLIGGKVHDDTQRHWLRFLVSFGLFVLIGAAASLDVFYYDRLLRGAVQALLDFEAKHPGIQMSTTIEQAVGWGKYSAIGSYSAVLAVLVVFTGWSLRAYWRDKRSKAVTVAPAATEPAEVTT